MRTGSYTENEEKLLCKSWVEIGQDPKIGVDQEGGTLWKRVHDFFHEHRKFEPYKI